LTGEGRGEGDSSEIPPAVNFDTFAGYWIVAAINQGGRAFSIEIDNIEDMQYLSEMCLQKEKAYMSIDFIFPPDTRMDSPILPQMLPTLTKMPKHVSATQKTS
jgi:hypothetical protein